MIDEEADTLDEYYTKNPPRVDPNKNSGFAKKSFKLVAINDFCAGYLMTKALSDHKTPDQIINEIVRGRITHLLFSALQGRRFGAVQHRRPFSCAFCLLFAFPGVCVCG